MPGDEPIVIGRPIPGLELTISQEVPIADFSGSLGASIDFSDLEGGQGAGWTDYPYFDFRELAEGEYLYSDGRVSTDPCGMYPRDW
ncbi:hypothetical protein [Microbacterium sp. NIBRBAC000506063]|uniref:hypothetical protein n=1 Tax=Microbacterium sp. NIBRBAC000506063 TaxID=2734618 RepID=UPI001BB5B85C|nr:hypothetical protein [Microbacterium sp. NIBRBAC000506063]QTV79685.1 hypothetical protein KAE78_12950 [Microbacterium sp. NIBRBAC000506063]